MGRHSAPARGAAPKEPAQPRRRTSQAPLLPALALAVTGFATFGAAALGTTQAAAEDRPTTSTAPARVLTSPGQAAQLEAREHGPSTRDLARSALRRERPDPPKNPGLASLPSTANRERGGRPVVDTGECEASYYNTGSVTANGESFDPSQLTAAHKTLPFNTMVRVINKANGESVVVRINDRGPYIAGRCIDLTPPGMEAIAGPGVGTADVRYEVLGEK